MEQIGICQNEIRSIAEGRNYPPLSVEATDFHARVNNDRSPAGARTGDGKALIAPVGNQALIYYQKAFRHTAAVAHLQARVLQKILGHSIRVRARLQKLPPDVTNGRDNSGLCDGTRRMQPDGQSITAVILTLLAQGRDLRLCRGGKSGDNRGFPVHQLVQV